jgi:hypothetical protein
MDETVTCFYHNVLIADCSGPHRAIRTNRLEVLAPGQKLKGIPFDQAVADTTLAILDALWDTLHPGEPNPRLS